MEEIPREFSFLTRNLFLLLCGNEKDATLSIQRESASGNKQARLVKITTSKQSAETSHLRHAAKALFELYTRIVHTLHMRHDKRNHLHINNSPFVQSRQEEGEALHQMGLLFNFTLGCNSLWHILHRLQGLQSRCNEVLEIGLWYRRIPQQLANNVEERHRNGRLEHNVENLLLARRGEVRSDNVQCDHRVELHHAAQSTGRDDGIAIHDALHSSLVLVDGTGQLRLISIGHTHQLHLRLGEGLRCAQRDDLAKTFRIVLVNRVVEKGGRRVQGRQELELRVTPLECGNILR